MTLQLLAHHLSIAVRRILPKANRRRRRDAKPKVSDPPETAGPPGGTVDPDRSPSWLRNTRGVTLSELLTVMTIVGITSAIALPKLDLPHYAIDSAMRA